MDRNPAGDFVLHGRRTPIRYEKAKEYLTNSQRTISTHNLSQTSQFRPDSRNSSSSTHSTAGQPTTKLNRQNRRYHQYHSQKEELEPVFDAESLFGSMNGGTVSRQARQERTLQPKDSKFSLDLTDLGNSLNKSLSKSVSFSDHLIQYGAAQSNGNNEDDDDDLSDTFEEELQQLIDRDTAENEHYEQELAGRPKSKHEASWFIEPIHLTSESEYPVFKSLGVDIPRTSPVSRTAGMVGTELAQQKIANQMLMDDSTREYFPVTLGEMPSIMRTVTPQPPSSVRSHSGAQRRNKASRRMSSPPTIKSSKQSLLSGRQSTPDTMTYDHSKASALYDYNYLRASKPFVDQTVMVSPYQYELAQLKMERLRLEEQRFLESKRQEELERIRGPTPKWYEIKSPQFTYELQKNNQLLESKKDWQNLIDYRNQLTKASQEFAQTNLGGGSFP